MLKCRKSLFSHQIPCTFISTFLPKVTLKSAKCYTLPRYLPKGRSCIQCCCFIVGTCIIASFYSPQEHYFCSQFFHHHRHNLTLCRSARKKLHFHTECLDECWRHKVIFLLSLSLSTCSSLSTGSWLPQY